MSNPISWQQALDQGYNPRDYSYHKEDIPIGEYLATLDFKIWSKVQGITIYFSKVDSNQKFQLTVFRNHGDREYTLEACDFRDCPIKKQYYITVEINSKGNIKFSKAKAA
jgi:hypothetical protein